MFVILEVVRLITPNLFGESTSTDEIEQTKIIIPIYATLIGTLPALLAPFFEELAFRNNLFFKFRNSPIFYIIMAVVSSILFEAIHYYNFDSLIATIPYMAIGLYYCIIYHFKKNIFYTIFPHLLLNWMNTFLSIIGLFFLYTNPI